MVMRDFSQRRWFVSGGFYRSVKLDAAFRLRYEEATESEPNLRFFMFSEKNVKFMLSTRSHRDNQSSFGLEEKRHF